MKIYKAVKFNKKLPYDKIDNFLALFSEKPQIISSENTLYACVRYNPDTYLKNEQDIGKLYESETISSLIMNNYRFLALLLKISREELVTFKNFSFYHDDSEEADIDKEEIESQINQGSDLNFTFDVLEDKNQKIKYVELHLNNPKNMIRVYASGNIGLSNSFEPIYNEYILKLVEFLFTGHNV
ncbi:hypothetical protein [Lactococcus lactis]|uniref:hypothetical protein n=1 Tax=Lactococcus lactis TaxID=1358 RepID=UPI000BA7855E|nr:hypothetical protein [Lactococcus lactis]PAK66215.1 hypothetical protein B8W94_11875 [Lactococcus lactis]PEN20130.1 hypothetical protein CRM88_01890 [Lactococcus lactis]